MTQIPDQAVQAAAKAIAPHTRLGEIDKSAVIAKLALTAALPYLTASVEVGDDDGSMTPEEIRLENLKQMAKYDGAIISFDCRDPYYLASCDCCGWVGSSELCGTDSCGDDSDVYCPRCHSSGADCGKVAELVIAKPGDIASWAKNLLAAWDQWYSCRQRDDAVKALSDKLIHAACFAGIAYDAAMSLPITTDRAPEYLLRIFLIALVDQNSPELDPYRAINTPQTATLTDEGTKPVDVAAVRRQAFEEACIELEVNWPHIATPEMRNAIRDLSPAEPVEQWQDMKYAPLNGETVVVFDSFLGSKDGRGVVVARFDKEHGWHVSASVVGGIYIKLTNPIKWMPRPPAPTSKGGE